MQIFRKLFSGYVQPIDLMNIRRIATRNVQVNGNNLNKLTNFGGGGLWPKIKDEIRRGLATNPAGIPGRTQPVNSFATNGTRKCSKKHGKHGTSSVSNYDRSVGAARVKSGKKKIFKRSRSSLSGTRHFAWQLSDCSSAPTLFSVIPQEAIFKQRHPSVSAWKQTRKKRADWKWTNQRRARSRWLMEHSTEEAGRKMCRRLVKVSDRGREADRKTAISRPPHTTRRLKSRPRRPLCSFNFFFTSSAASVVLDCLFAPPTADYPTDAS